MSKRLLLFAVLLAVGICVCAGPAAAKSQPGNVDPSFGVGGTVVQPRGLISPSGFYGPFGEDMAVGLEDEIYVLQSERDCRGGSGSCAVRLFVQRYRRDGSLDTGFGTQGQSVSVTVAKPIFPSSEVFGGRSASIAVTAANEVVVATVDGESPVLYRIDRSGQLSSAFGTSGRATAPLGGAKGQPRLAILSDGRILVAVNSPQPDGTGIVGLARFGPDGALDTSFGAGLGESSTPGALAVGSSSAADFSVSPGGRIALAGARCCSTKRSSIYFGRRNSDGRPLRPFSVARPWRNLKIVDLLSVDSVLALPGGRIAVVATSRAGAFVARLLPSGRRDRGFGKAGIVRLGRISIGASPALADTAGNIYVGGHRYVGEEYVPNRALVARVTRRGRVDRRWGAAPPGYSLITRSMSEPLAMGFQSTGKLVVFGEYSGDCIRSCSLPGRVLTRLYTSRRQGP